MCFQLQVYPKCHKYGGQSIYSKSLYTMQEAGLEAGIRHTDLVLIIPGATGWMVTAAMNYRQGRKECHFSRLALCPNISTSTSHTISQNSAWVHTELILAVTHTDMSVSTSESVMDPFLLDNSNMDRTPSVWSQPQWHLSSSFELFDQQQVQTWSKSFYKDKLETRSQH